MNSESDLPQFHITDKGVFALVVALLRRARRKALAEEPGAEPVFRVLATPEIEHRLLRGMPLEARAEQDILTGRPRIMGCDVVRAPRLGEPYRIERLK